MSVLFVKQRSSISEPPFGKRTCRGNVYDSCLTRLKPRGRTKSEHTSKSAVVEGMGHFEAKYQAEELRLPPTSIHHSIQEWFYM